MSAAQARGGAVSCTPVPGGRRYAVGLEFVRIAPEAQERLVRVLAGQEA